MKKRKNSSHLGGLYLRGSGSQPSLLSNPSEQVIGTHTCQERPNPRPYSYMPTKAVYTRSADPETHLPVPC